MTECNKSEMVVLCGRNALYSVINDIIYKIASLYADAYFPIILSIIP